MARAEAPHHPAPHRHRAGWALVFGLGAAPLSWLAQTSVNYGLMSHACYPAAEPLRQMITRWPWSAAAVINLLAVVIAAAAAVTAWRIWRRTREEAEGGASNAIEAGEGRTRFLSLWAAMASAGFAIALFFSLIALFSVPPCGYP